MKHRPSVERPAAVRFGSDAIADVLRALDIEYIALTPGASFRGLHDSLVNHLGNTRPQILLCVHEEHAVALAHGYARVTGRPMAVALHSNVGLMHATMAIFNAWCDRVPVLILGGVGPMDAVKRRPWVDWIHTARDLGALVRGYTKWDDQPASVVAAQEALLRAHRIAIAAPQGPVFVVLDAALQEEPEPAPAPLPPLERFAPASAGDPPAAEVSRAAAVLAAARKPLLLMGRMSAHADDFARRVRLAERLDARVLTDLKTGASFPTGHALHPCGPSLYVGDPGNALIRDADVIVSFDWIDLAGTLRQACAGELPRARVIQCTMEPYIYNGFSMDYQALPPAEIALLAPPDRFVALLLDELPAASVESAWPGAPPERPRAAVAAQRPTAGRIPIEDMARVVVDTLAPHRPSYIRLPIGWPGEHCRFAHPQDYIGFDGGGGIGSGPGMAVGAALALRRSERLPVAVVGDGDFLMGTTALWTAAHYRVPVLVVVVNNQSFFNDELHQERVARMRGRPVENRGIGLTLHDPAIDLAKLAQGQGAVGLGPVDSLAGLGCALAEGAARVRAGAVCVIDVRVAPEYARAVSSSLLRRIATD
jgi:thiamine pyrophosphate-dependent acetolactate synthase large subunit-like protein